MSKALTSAAPAQRSTPKTCVVKIRRLPHAHDLPLPSYQTADAAGMDLTAAVEADVVMQPGGRALVPTGLIFELPPGTEAQVRPRSGLAAKFGVTVLNSPGTIDADYRGEVSVILINHGSEPFRIKRGDRIAQMIVAPVTQAQLVEVAVVTDTGRGAGGFGSTGVAASHAAPRAPKRMAVAPKAKNVKTTTQKRTKAKRAPSSKR